ncbi:MAG: AAA family ATPase, partial [Burkholderiales bacterium]|nr:AAA family ATPase [Opitutaceae bacterium]
MNPPAPLEAVRRQLIDVAGLVELSPPGTWGQDRIGPPPPTLADALAYACRGFHLASSASSPLSWQVDGHFTLEAHGLVIDGRLGSIGLVHLLPDPDPSIADEKARLADLETRINHLIENAAYLRHLLALQRSAASDPMRLLLPAIEVVFLAGAMIAPRSALAIHLRKSLQESALLHALSVNLASALLDADLRRAFCWLLPSTQAWLAGRPATSAAPVAWNGLRLENFRRPGMRHWTKAAAARLHVIHGPNGSGKTSLAEGFEYAVTGDSTRLKKTSPPPEPVSAASPGRYAPLIFRSGNTPPQGATRAALHLDKDTLPLFNRSAPPAPGDSKDVLAIPGGSFRLDQKLVDQLSLSDSATRARIWLETFFPEQDRLRAARHEARKALRSAIVTLVSPPDETSADRLLQALVEQAQRLAGGAVAPLAEFLLPLLGPGAGSSLDPARLGELGLQLPALLSFDFSASDTGEAAWTQARRDELTRQAGRLLPQDAAVLTDWRATDHAALRQLLEDLGRRGFGESSANLHARIDEGDDHPTTFNRHLRVVALLDLLDRARVIARTTDALPAGASDPILSGIKPKLSPAKIDAEINTLRGERETLHRRLSALHERERARRGDPDPTALTEGQLASIRAAVEADVFSPFLDAEHAAEFIDAIRHRREGRVR